MKENRKNGQIEKHSYHVMKMDVKGIQKLTLVDYPGKIACTLFLFGCNFRCGFCHNPELVLENGLKSISEEEIFSFLEKRKNQLEGVCLTGGEPLLTLEKEFLKKIKEMGYPIKLDTNGSFPEKLKEFIDKKLIDFIAMDIKSGKEKYGETAGAKIDLKKIEESIRLIVNSGLDYEFRTTVIQGIHSEEEIEKIGKWVYALAGGKAKKYSLQGFKNSGKFIDSKYSKEKDVSEEFLKEISKSCNNYFKDVEIKV
jgi:pyruvate formate lyase activating enzyme